MSASQWHEPMDPMELDDDWLVAIFGGDPIKTEDPSTAAYSSQALVPAEDQEPQPEVDGGLAPIDPPQHEEEEQDQVAAQPGFLKPLYDFRRIFKKLPKLAETDEVAAKRLILGLHERMWHASYSELIELAASTTWSRTSSTSDD